MTFDEFEKISSKQWKQKIQFELDGKEFNSTLVWKSIEGVNVKPFYHFDADAESVSIEHRAKDWKIGHSIYVQNEKAANQKAKQCLNHGAECLYFVFPHSNFSFSILLEGINFSEITLYFEPLFLQEILLTKFKAFFSNQPHSIYCLNDPIGHLGRHGNWYHNRTKDLDIVGQNLKKLNQCKSVISVDTALYQNAGADMIQQLAFGLAHANEYLNLFSGTAFKTIVFKLAIGGNYFFEIAKLQAHRLLWQSLMQNHDMNIDCHIISTPSKRNKTVYDFNNNLLRTTTEIMSAALGNSDVIINTPYDALYKRTNNFSDRLALNQLLILKNESYLNAVANPAEGAYYIESLTKHFATQALEMFKIIEQEGGFLNQLKSGAIQKKISMQAQKEQQRYDSNEEVLVGIHKQSNLQQFMKSQVELYPFLKQNPRKTLIQPIIEKRIADSIEKQRLDHE